MPESATELLLVGVAALAVIIVRTVWRRRRENDRIVRRDLPIRSLQNPRNK